RPRGARARGRVPTSRSCGSASRCTHGLGIRQSARAPGLGGTERRRKNEKRVPDPERSSWVGASYRAPLDSCDVPGCPYRVYGRSLPAYSGASTEDGRTLPARRTVMTERGRLATPFRSLRAPGVGCPILVLAAK